ncbi:MAG: hypothetical protein LKM43_04050 [Wolbachia endosymbiont of Penenirmus auritus]|nr:hypothetical protein [Wolbachia endosymbiont of Penenirmus auritus]
MPENEKGNINNTVETQTENSSSKDSLEQKIESLGKEIKSLRKQNRGIIGLGVIGLIGYIIATNWSAIAPASATAATATVAAAPVIGIVIGTIIGAAVLVGASYAVWRYRAEIKAGFKYAAEKTVGGAKHTAGKIKAGAVYVKDSVKKGYENSVDSLERGAGKVKSAIGSALETVGHKISSTGEDMNTSYKLTDSTDTGVLLLTEDGKKEYNSIRNALRNISDKHLLEKMSSEMVSLIDSKIESEKNMIDFQNKGNLHKSEALISRWIKQKNSIVELDPKGLQKRLSYEGYDHDLYQIFSEHHNEIKKVISQCKREYEFDQSVKRNNAKDEEERKASKSPLFSSLGGESPKQLDNSLSPVTDSTPPNSGSQQFAKIAPRVRRNSTGNLTKVETPKVPTRSNSLPDLSMVGNAPKESSLEEAFFNDPTVKELWKSLYTSSSFSSSASDDASVVPKSPTSGYGSKRSSPISSGGSTPGSRFVTANSSGKSTPTSGLSKPVDRKALAKKLEELRKSSSGSSTPTKPPVPPKPLAGNLANEQKEQQGLSTPRNGSDSGINSPNLSGSPIGGESPSVQTLIKAFDKTQLTGRAQPSSKVGDNVNVQRQVGQGVEAGAAQ